VEISLLYRAVDRDGQTVDFLLTPQRDKAAAEAFLHKAIRTQGLPEKITIDRSGSNTAAIKCYNSDQVLQPNPQDLYYSPALQISH
jgi:transposase-like protein